MRELLRLAQLEALTDSEMARALRAATVDPSAPMPSVEAILHAILPFRFVDHAHPDALLSVMNTPSGRARVEKLYGDEVIVVPYVMPGFLLARRCALEVPGRLEPQTCGVVLMHHGLVTFGNAARESYERMIDLVDRAEKYLQERDAWEVARDPGPGANRELRVSLAELRRDVSIAAGRPMILARSSAPSPPPGPGAAAYSSSKAALTQLARVAALEWREYGVRVNVVHPNAVFDTGIWSGDVLTERAARYGLTVDEYRRSNVLGVEVTSADVARMIVTTCGPAFSRTTGAQVSVDGGNQRVI